MVITQREKPLLFQRKVGWERVHGVENVPNFFLKETWISGLARMVLGKMDQGRKHRHWPGTGGAIIAVHDGFVEVSVSLALQPFEHGKQAAKAVFPDDSPPTKAIRLTKDRATAGGRYPQYRHRLARKSVLEIGTAQRSRSTMT